MNSIKNSHSFIKFLPIIFLILLSVGCGRDSFAVILWPETDNLSEIGEIVRVKSIDSSQQSARVLTDLGTNKIIETWRLSIVPDRLQAEQFQNEFAEYRFLFAQCRKKALPLRSEPNRFSEIQYRFDVDETLKIIDRVPMKSNEGGLVDYWYRVLTKSGDLGWVFGYHLTLLSVTDDGETPPDTVDFSISHLLNNVWRPAYFQSMIETNRIDLQTFNIQFGLFPAPLEQRIAIQLPHGVQHINYDSIEQADSRTIYFGSNRELTIEIIDTDYIRAHYTYQNTPYVEEFHIITDNINQIIYTAKAEQASRLQDILQLGDRFFSREAGNLMFARGMRFQWDAPRKAPAELLLNSGANSGTVAFDINFNAPLSVPYDGTIIFTFQSGRSAPLYCLYRIEKNRLILTQISAAAVRNNRPVAVQDALQLVFASR